MLSIVYSTKAKFRALTSGNSGIWPYYILPGCGPVMSPTFYTQWHSCVKRLLIFCTCHITLYSCSLRQLILQPKITFPQIELFYPSPNGILFIQSTWRYKGEQLLVLSLKILQSRGDTDNMNAYIVWDTFP